MLREWFLISCPLLLLSRYDFKKKGKIRGVESYSITTALTSQVLIYLAVGIEYASSGVCVVYFFSKMVGIGVIRVQYRALRM